MAVFVSVALAGALLSACGGGGAGAQHERVIARVGSSAITEAALHHWMATWIKFDYYQAVGARAPSGLASDPPNYAACVSAAQRLQLASRSKPAAAKAPKLTTAQLGTKCRQLYHSVSLQALSSLISELWGIGQVAELGQSVSSQEVAHRFQEVRYERYPTARSLQTYLSNAGLSLTDLRYTVKNDLLSSIYLKGVQRKAGIGGQLVAVKLINASNTRWKGKTHCNPAYLVWQCSGFSEAAKAPPSVAVLLEEISR